MKFSKISINKDDEVKLVRVDEHQHAKDSIETSGVNPLPEFVDAFKSFLPAFLEFMPELKSAKDELRVTTLSLGDKDGMRSLQVSVARSIESMGAISMTTPRMTEEPEEPNEDAIYLSKTMLKLIERVEAEATRYVNGETAQGTLALGTSENSKAVDERMGAAEVKSTRTPRHQKPKVENIPVEPSPVALH